MLVISRPIIISAETKSIEEVLKSAVALTIANNQPVVLLVKKGTFGPYKLKKRYAGHC